VNALAEAIQLDINPDLKTLDSISQEANIGIPFELGIGLEGQPSSV
jgi:hypothetical protein